MSAEADAICAGLMGSWSSSRSAAVPAGLAAADWDRQLLTTSTLGPYVGRRRGPVTVLAAGVGGPAAAAGTATALAVASTAGEPFGLVVSMGTAGGFRGCADIGDLLVADRMLAADLGAEAGVELPDSELDRDRERDPAFGRPGRLRGLDASLGFGSPRAATGSDPGAEFLSLDELGLGSGTVRPDPRLVARLAAVLDVTGRRVVTGTVVTVATVTGTEQRAAVLTRRHDPVGEAMEGYAVGVAATAYRVPSAEIRAVSNAVGRRDRSTWDIPAALASLRTAAGALVAHAEGLLAAS